MQANGDNITGETFDFDASLSSQSVYVASNLVPLANNLVGTAISKSSNKSRDINSRDVCSLYQITLSNSGDSITLTPFVTTISTTYTTTNLKMQLFDSSYNAVSDVITPSISANGKVYFTTSSNNITVNLSSSNIVYYLAIWITETSSSQTADYSKTYNGTITFEAASGGQLSVDFTS